MRSSHRHRLPAHRRRSRLHLTQQQARQTGPRRRPATGSSDGSGALRGRSPPAAQLDDHAAVRGGGRRGARLRARPRLERHRRDPIPRRQVLRERRAAARHQVAAQS